MHNAGVLAVWSQCWKRWVAGQERRSTRGRLASRRRKFERLECRAVLAADALPKITPAWFEIVNSNALNEQRDTAAQPAAGQYWNVQLSVVAAQTLGSVGSASALLAGAPGAVEIVRGLGGVGQLQIRTWGAPQAVAPWLSSNPSVAGFQPDELVTLDAIPNDTSWNSLWGLENAGQTGGTVDADIDAPTAWNRTTGDSDVVVAVIDTGVDYNHPDLAGNIWTNPGEIAGDGIDNDGNGFVDDLHGWDFVNNDSDPIDDHNHGTHVAGTIGAVGNNGLGIVGVNWDVSLMALKMLDAGGSGTNSQAIAAINYATMMRERGVNVRASSNSWSGGGFDTSMFNAIAAQRDADIIFVAAAGNSTRNNDTTPAYPSSYNLTNIIAVAATDHRDQLASFSNYGATSVDLAAPGVNILSTVRGGLYSSFNGTSMATPHVSGVVALAAALVPDANHAELKAAILSSAEPKASLAGKMVTGGRLNAAGALDAILASRTATPTRYLFESVPFEPIDLDAGPDVLTVLDNLSGETASLDLGSHGFRFYGQDYSGAGQLFVSANGLLTFSSANSSSANSNLFTSPAQPSIAPLWDDLQTGLGGADRVYAKFDDIDGDLNADRLIIEWSDVTRAPGSPSTATFQAILELDTGAADGDITFNYVDLDFDDSAADRGAGATIGIGAGGSSLNRLIASRDNAANSLIDSGAALRFDRTRPSAAWDPVTPAVRSTALDSAIITFSEPIDAASLGFADLSLTRDGIAVPLDNSLSFTALGDNRYQVGGLAPFTNFDGVYALSISTSDIRDVYGHTGLTTSSVGWSQDVATTNIKLISSTADGLTTLNVTYEIEYTNSPAFELRFAASSDLVYDASDTTTATASVSSFADLTVGLHTKTFTIGTGAGKIAIPGGGAAELSTDYYLLVVADSADSVPELDPGAPSSDNTTSFAGIYHLPANLVMVHGGAGNDSVVTSGSITVALNAFSRTYAAGDVTGMRVRLHDGDDSLNATTFSKALTAFGGDGHDLLTGSQGADTLFGGAGNDTLNAGSGNDLLYGEAGDDTQIGGSGHDVYYFDLDLDSGADTLNEAAGGTDTLDFSATSTVGATVNLGVATQQVVHANLKLTLGSATTFETLVGGAGNDHLTGNASGNVITGGPGNDTLVGAAGSDTYWYDADSPLGADTLVEATGGGTDLIEFSATTSTGITLDLSATTTQLVAANGNLSLTLSASNVFENITGSAQGDSLTGNSLSNTLLGGLGDDTLAGGTGNDTYPLDADLALGTDTLVEYATGGTDHIDFSTTSSKSLSLNLSQLGTTQTVAAGFSSIRLLGGDFENLTGGGLNDTLIGNSLNNILTGYNGNDTLVGADGNDTLNAGGGNDTLEGGAGNDLYPFKPDAALGVDSISESVGGGVDLIDFSSTTTNAVTFDLSLAGAQVVNGYLTLNLSGGDVIEQVYGGAKNDTLFGNALDNLLDGRAGNDSLSGRDGADTLIGGAGDDTLAGNQGNDSYAFAANSALNVDTLVELPGEGTDLIDFSNTTALGVVVNLSLTSTQVANTYVSIILSSDGVFERLIGTGKNDTLRGNALDNLLVGGAGNDLLEGFAGRDLLVGGTGLDTVNGGEGDDIVISGTFSYYSEATRLLNAAAIDALATAWGSADDYATRVAAIRAGVPGGYKLDATTVLTDGTSIDALLGGLDLDWFWKFGSDTTTDLNLGGSELIN